VRNSYRIATIGGIAIYVNWSWLLALAFMTWSLGQYYLTTYPSWSPGTAYLLGFLSGVLLFATVLVHELAHSFTARAQDLPVKEITLFIFGGVSNLTQEPQTPRIELLVTIAGPLASLLLGGFFLAVHRLLPGMPAQASAVIFYLGWVNLVLAIFNLIPGFPLDGGRVLRALLWLITGSMRRATFIAGNVGQIVGYLFIFGGILMAFVLGQLISGIWLAFIGFFLQNSASGSQQRATMDRMLLGVDVRDVMDPPPTAAPQTASIEMLVYHYMLEQNQRAIPINGPDRSLQGLVTLSDTARLPRERWSATPVSEIMTRLPQLRTVSPDQDLRSAMRAMAENDYHQLPVTEDGRLAGMLNRGHVLQYLHMRQRLDRQGPSNPPPGDGLLGTPRSRVG